MKDLGLAFDWFESLEQGTEETIDIRIHVLNLTESGLSEQDAISAIY